MANATKSDIGNTLQIFKYAAVYVTKSRWFWVTVPAL